MHLFNQQLIIASSQQLTSQHKWQMTNTINSADCDQSKNSYSNITYATIQQYAIMLGHKWMNMNIYFMNSI